MKIGNFSCLSDVFCYPFLTNTFRATSFRLVYNQTFSLTNTGPCTVWLSTKILYNPALSNIFFWSENAELSYYEDNSWVSNSQFDLIWMSNTLKRIDNTKQIKFSIAVLVEQFIFEQFFSISYTYNNSSLFNVTYLFPLYASTQVSSVTIWTGNQSNLIHCFQIRFKK